MDKKQFMELLGKAYQFPEYYSLNLDSADEILEDLKDASGHEKLSLKPWFEELLSTESEAEKAKIWAFLTDHFRVE